MNNDYQQVLELLIIISDLSKEAIKKLQASEYLAAHADLCIMRKDVDEVLVRLDRMRKEKENV